MAFSSAVHRSIPHAGASLCAPPPSRYLAPRMYGILVGILILDSLILATAVLLQAGQGGGLPRLGGGAGPPTTIGGRQATPLLTQGTRGAPRGLLFFPLVLAFPEDPRGPPP